MPTGGDDKGDGGILAGGGLTTSPGKGGRLSGPIGNGAGARSPARARSPRPLATIAKPKSPETTRRSMANLRPNPLGHRSNRLGGVSRGDRQSRRSGGGILPAVLR